tara:strand:- start:990 stop:1193 length:204 start_codon:yes stop_codon:yes gene_type:complete
MSYKGLCTVKKTMQINTYYLMPVGALIAGGIAQFYGADIAILIGGTITFTLFIVGIFIFKPLWDFKS